MRAAINIIPLKTSHKDRGIGQYTLNLIETLKSFPNVSIQQFTNINEVKDVDVIHYPWFDFFLHTLPRTNLAPIVITIHDVIPLKFKEHFPLGIKGRINLYLQKMALGKCRAIIADSKTTQKDILDLLKVEKSKVFVIPLAADKDFMLLKDGELIRTKRKYSLPDKFLLYVGDANWTKNLPFLIDAFSNLTLNQACRDLKLVLVGGVFLKNVDNIDHPELESLKRLNILIKRYNLEEKILKIGSIDKKDLVAFYNLATIYVQPSIYEGFGLPILEAMSCGTPVVSSYGGSLPEVGGPAPVYFDPQNREQFESIILEVLENKSLQGKLSRLGLIQSEKFSWSKTAVQTLQVYSNVINS